MKFFSRFRYLICVSKDLHSCNASFTNRTGYALSVNFNDCYAHASADLDDTPHAIGFSKARMEHVSLTNKRPGDQNHDRDK